MPIKLNPCHCDKIAYLISLFATDTIQVNIIARFGALVNCEKLIYRNVDDTVHRHAKLRIPFFDTGKWEISKFGFYDPAFEMNKKKVAIEALLKINTRNQ